MGRNNQFVARLFVARIAVAGLLLLTLLATNLPFAALAEASNCNLACCAGMPPHAAGSCMGGSCHTGLMLHEEKVPQPLENAEPLCGLTAQITQGTLIPTVYAEPTNDADQTTAQVSSAVMAKTCQPDCGTCSTSSNPNRQRDSVVLRKGERNKPQLNLAFEAFTHPDNLPLEPDSRSGSPRGPPNSFS